MPTNVCKPIWVCDICGTSFDADLAAARRCEDAGHPLVLADGALLLVHSEYTPKGYRLAPLRPTARFGTRASRYSTEAGHIARYEVEGELYDGRPRVRSSDWMWPHLPGFLQVEQDAHGRPGSGRGMSRQATTRTAGVTAWPLARAGLGVDQDRVDDQRHGTDTPRLVRPITPEVAAVLGMLRAVLAQGSSRTSWYDIRGGLAVVAAENTARRDGLPPGVYDSNRSAWWLAQAPTAGLLDEVEDRQRRWMQGEQITVPRPRLRSTLRVAGGYAMSASKLSKAQRRVVADTGVEWPARTSADEYLALLLTKCLEATMTEVSDANGLRGRGLFGGVPIRAAVTSTKGGVGKTTSAAALALALATGGQNVVLVDLNLPNPGQHTLWGLGPVKTDEAARLILPEVVAKPAGTLAVFSHGQLAPAGTPAAAVIDTGRAAEWILFLAGNLDLRGVTTVVFDLPPGWDEVHRQVFDPYSLPLTACVHVTTGHPLAAANETLAGPGSRGPNAPRLPRWLIENLSRARGVMTDSSGRIAEIRLYDSGPDLVRSLAEREGATFGGSLPWEPDPHRLAQAPEVVALAEGIVNASTAAADA